MSNSQSPTAESRETQQPPPLAEVEESEGTLPDHTIIVDFVARQFGVPKSEISLDTELREIPGWDSLLYIELILEVEDIFDIDIKDSALDSLVKVGDLVNVVKEILE